MRRLDPRLRCLANMEFVASACVAANKRQGQGELRPKKHLGVDERMRSGIGGVGKEEKDCKTERRREERRGEEIPRGGAQPSANR
mmetsp:Transcript_79392/g.164831  ORF Transcript_79392/g.164831 Transcript_79392/m.164831 type:complete len:85 (-) Transcript_79392:167-421(-)